MKRLIALATCVYVFLWVPNAAFAEEPQLSATLDKQMAKTNEEIIRLINASSEPFSGAFCEFENEKMIIWRAEILNDNENYLAVAGQVSKLNEDGTIELICGMNKIKITEIEYDGVRTTQVTSVIKSIRKRLK